MIADAAGIIGVGAVVLERGNARKDRIAQLGERGDVVPAGTVTLSATVRATEAKPSSAGLTVMFTSSIWLLASTRKVSVVAAATPGAKKVRLAPVPISVTAGPAIWVMVKVPEFDTVGAMVTSCRRWWWRPARR